MSMLLGLIVIACQSDKPPERPEIKYDAPGMMTDERAVYPDSGMIENTFVFIDSSLLGIDSLNRFYSADYVLNGDTVRLFTSHDYSGVQYLKFMSHMKTIDTVSTLPPGIEFDHGYGFITEHAAYGRIIVGLVNFRLVGMIGFDADKHTDFFSGWISDLPPPPEFSPTEDTLEMKE